MMNFKLSIHWFRIGLVLLIYNQKTNGKEPKSFLSDCKLKVDEQWQQHFCEDVCQNFKNINYQGDGQQLYSPSVPSLVKTGFRSIRLTWSALNISNAVPVVYILELQPNWTEHGQNVIHPFIPKYYHTNQTIHTVENLVAKTGYKFRVFFISTNGTSLFSNWSKIYQTNFTCFGLECSVTNIRLELSAIFYQWAMARLDGIFYWEPEKEIQLDNKDIYFIVDVKNVQLLQYSRYCRHFFADYEEKLTKESLTEKNASFHKFKATRQQHGAHAELYFNCLYEVKLVCRKDIWSPDETIATWTFYVPECFTFPKVCGCKDFNPAKKEHFGDISFTPTPGNTSTVHIRWTGERWKNDINVTYYRVEVNCAGTKHVNSSQTNIYSVSFFNLTNERKCDFTIYAYHGDKCSHDVAETSSFLPSYPCTGNPCGANMTCHRRDYVSRDHLCKCIAGFSKIDGVCIDIDPCQNNSCHQNATCFINDKNEGYLCRCNNGFEERTNNTCIPVRRTSIGRSAISGGAIAAIVISILVIVVIAVGIVWCQRSYQKKELRDLRTVMGNVFYNNTMAGTFTTTNNPYDYQPSVVRLPDEPKGVIDDRESNILYIPQEIADALERGLTDGLFELARDRLRLGQVIGRGAFGEVHVADAILSEQRGWQTVAVKKLADSATHEEIQDFLGEIELMKKIGEHQNVIQMYGCCTKRPPMCLIMEYAARGSLDKYLRSLKQKCFEASKINNEEFNKQDMSEKSKFEKFFEQGEMPHDSETDSFPRSDVKEKSTKDEARNNNVENIEEQNKVIAAKVNEKIKTALNPKELESFARQIANGMTHLASLGIIHRDLAARNILLDENHVLKISDFGLSRENILYVKTTRGRIPIRWLSIEAIQERTYTAASDVWAFGVVLWEICTLGDVPYPSVHENDFLEYLVAGNRMTKPESCTKEIYEIMLKCWSYRPQDRPTFVELVRLLWDLEHEGNTYVNLEILMEHASSNMEDLSDDATEKSNNKSRDSQKSNMDEAGVDNPGFSDELGDVDDTEHILPRKNKSALSKIKGSKDTTEKNGISNLGTATE